MSSLSSCRRHHAQNRGQNARKEQLPEKIAVPSVRLGLLYPGSIQLQRLAGSRAEPCEHPSIALRGRGTRIGT